MLLGIDDETTKARLKNKTIKASNFQPDQKLRDFLEAINADLEIGKRNMERSYKELNDRTIIQEINITAKAFNTYIEPRRSDPLHSWRAQTRRPVVRNKLISMIAHATAAIIIPGMYAYNDSGEIDSLAANSMRSLIKWVIYNTDYPMQFIYMVMQMMSQPAAIFEVGYREVERTIKTEDGPKQVMDDILSGFFFNHVPANELLIDNPFESNIQKQRFTARVKLISYDEAKAVHGKKKRFEFVKPGVSTTMNYTTGMFYDIEDEPELQGRLVREVTYRNRLQDIELVVLNGIPVGDEDAGIPHTHKRYPYAKGVYEPINNGSFFYGKSAANKLLPDEYIINLLRNMFLDGTFLTLMPPHAVFGTESVHQTVMVPGAMTAFEEEVRLENIGPKSDIRSGLVAMQEVERSIVESSQDNLSAGIISDIPDRTPGSVVRDVQANAQQAMGLTMKFLSFMVTDVADLLVSNILQYMTVPVMTGSMGIEEKMRYHNFIIPEEQEGGTSVNKRLIFNPDFFLTKNPMTKSQLEYAVMKFEGGIDSNQRITVLNPDVFRNLKYKAYTGTDTLVMNNTAMEKALKLETYDRLIANPLTDQQAVTEDFLIGALAPGKADRYMKQKSGPLTLTGGQPMPAAPVQPTQQPDQNLTGQLTGSNSLQNTLSMQGGDAQAPMPVV
jgi:hypothetical protein